MNLCPKTESSKKVVCRSPYTTTLSNFFSLVKHYSPKEAVLSKPEKICKTEDNMVGAVPEVWVLESGTGVRDLGMSPNSGLVT